MEIFFQGRKLQKICSSQKAMVRAYGPRLADCLQQRLAELESAETLEDMKFFPAARCHELMGSRKGQLAVDLIHPKRLIFIPEHDPPPAKSDGGLDWQQVTRIIIIETVDYH